MPLSQQIQDQIRDIVESAVIDYSGFVHDNPAISGNKWFETDKANRLLSILEGWAVWKEKADGYRKAMKEIESKVMQYHKLNGDNPAANHCRNIAIEALEQFK